MFSTNAGLLVTEIGFYALIVAAAFAFPRVNPKWFRSLQARYIQLARRRALSIGFVAALVLVFRGALIPLLPTPVPAVHDEYSYLLAGDTFASGRLTNPPHPLWKSLETFYVIQHPTYASMYPPAQGLALAAGYLLGHPWIGVYLSVAAMCGAICWMLQGWVPPQWALTGGLIAVLRWGVYSYWMESYWGGAVAALGGALAVGALPRLLRKRTVWPAVTVGIGLLIMANSRPFEGLLLGVLVFGILAFKLWQAGPIDLSFLFRQVALPLAAVLLVGAVSMGYYFWRVTGNPLEMPYKVHSAVYEVTDPFIWGPLRKAPEYRYAVMERYHVGRQTAAYNEAHSLRGWVAETWRKAESLAVFYLWPAILPTVVALPFLRRNAKVKIALFAAAVMFVGLTLEIWPMTMHYHAPLAGMMILLLIQVMRFWRPVEWRGRPVGAAISAAVPVLCALLLAIRVSAAVLHVPLPEHGLAPWFTVVPGNVDRAKVEAYLEHQYGPQLVLVRYDDTHHVDEEWVHNSADIDGSKVVWARDADPRQNAQLLAYFRQRHAWLVEVDVKPPRLTSLSSPTALLTTAATLEAAVPASAISFSK